ncbi:MAG: Sua5/YciO/YrdC/YwlC family protein [Planctomycetota bacterium]|nr:Sua5/YciO/YrdC/YwlC family protein [Planctomycetota bacterium]
MTTQPTPIEATGRGPSPDELAILTRSLDAGEVLLLPTETVYGLAARADRPQALDRLRELKGRPADVPLTWHLGTRSAQDTLAGLACNGLALPTLVQRLAHDFWPGPLTLVVAVDLPSDHPARGLVRAGLLGLRAPAHVFTGALLDAVAEPVVMSSANRHGQRPATDCDAALGALEGGQLGAAIDSGPTASSKARLSSTVLTLAPGRFEVQREGLLSQDDLRRSAGLRIGFACTGNTCRSPMAEVLALHAIAARLAGGQAPDSHRHQRDLVGRFGFEVSSMGLAAYPGSPASDNSVQCMAARGLVLSGHSSQPVELEQLAEFDAVYTMTRPHQAALVDGLRSAEGGRFAKLAERVHLLDPEGGDISDPFGGDVRVYEAAARDISVAIEARVADWV